MGSCPPTLRSENLCRTRQQLHQVLDVLKENLTCSTIQRRSFFEADTSISETR